jgi:hypothetical protein
LGSTVTIDIYDNGMMVVALRDLAIMDEAGLLSLDEIRKVNDDMLENVKASGMPSIGLTVYPTYPEGFFPGGMRFCVRKKVCLYLS